MPKAWVSVSNEIIGVEYGKDWPLYHYIMTFFVSFHNIPWSFLTLDGAQLSSSEQEQEHLVLPNLPGLSNLDVRPGLSYTQHPTQFHLIQMPSIRYSVSPLRNASAQAQTVLLEIYSVSSHSPIHPGSVSHPPKTHSSEWRMDTWPN